MTLSIATQEALWLFKEAVVGAWQQATFSTHYVRRQSGCYLHHQKFRIL